MPADGTWNIIVNSPMGAQPSTLRLTTDGAVVTGTQNRQQIANGRVEGNTVMWSTSTTNPVPMTLEFVGKVDGDTLNGEVKAGAFGCFPFTGSRPAVPD
jgi:hypothetical protein